VESDICEQLPAFNLQNTCCCSPLPDCSPPGEGGGGSASFEQAKKANTVAKIAANERKRLVFIVSSQAEKLKISYNNF
jgi:hypothetical protein